jgi:hypothetical protein
MSQRELAARTGISVKLISAYENERVRPRRGNWLLLLDVLDGTWVDEPAEGSQRSHPRPSAGAHAEPWYHLVAHHVAHLQPGEAAFLVVGRSASGEPYWMASRGKTDGDLAQEASLAKPAARAPERAVGALNHRAAISINS